MNALLSDFPNYVEKTESSRQQQAEVLAFDIPSDDLLYLLEDIMEEFEYIRSTWRDRSVSENREAIQEQLRKLSRN